MNLLGLEVPNARWHERDKMLAALDRWVRQRPGLEPGNYGDAKAYRAELRAIGRDLRDARAMLFYVASSYMPAETLRTAFGAYWFGRLQWDGERVFYITHQHWPTEYRRAACAVLAGAIRDYWLDYQRASESSTSSATIRLIARNAFRRGIVRRWFS